MRLLHHGELIRDAGHCESIGCHILAGWKAVYEDKTYSYLCDHHMTTLAQTTRRARKGHGDDAKPGGRYALDEHGYLAVPLRKE